MAHPNLSSLEKKALELIKRKKGILQSELWKTLKLDSREGSRLVLRLQRKGLIRREQVSVNGRRTYKLYPVELRPQDKQLLVDIGYALIVPCTTCPYFQACGNTPPLEPTSCPILDRWLDYMAKKREAGRNSKG
ncbi:MAG: Lrp/AsnC family transcriptional regulator [Desulfurococcales archaeon]|nr:Lrp/AsnC family transcriptional regulator [Desulfurococcales archaeon]